MCKIMWAVAWLVVGVLSVYMVQGFRDAMAIQNCKLMHTTLHCKIVDIHAEPVYNNDSDGGVV